MSVALIILLSILLCLAISRIEKEITVRKYEKIYFCVMDAYETMLYARRNYYHVHRTGDKENEEVLKEQYNDSRAILDDPTIKAKVINILPDELRDECLEIIDGPRYELY